MPQGVFDGLFGPSGRFIDRPDMGIGLVMGAASGGLIALDLDTKKPGQKAENWFNSILEVHNCGFDLDTWEQTHWRRRQASVLSMSRGLVDRERHY